MADTAPTPAAATDANMPIIQLPKTHTEALSLANDVVNPNHDKLSAEQTITVLRMVNQDVPVVETQFTQEGVSLKGAKGFIERKELAHSVALNSTIEASQRDIATLQTINPNGVEMPTTEQLQTLHQQGLEAAKEIDQVRHTVPGDLHRIQKAANGALKDPEVIAATAGVIGVLGGQAANDLRPQIDKEADATARQTGFSNMPGLLHTLAKTDFVKAAADPDLEQHVGDVMIKGLKWADDNNHVESELGQGLRDASKKYLIQQEGTDLGELGLKPVDADKPLFHPAMQRAVDDASKAIMSAGATPLSNHKEGEPVSPLQTQALPATTIAAAR